MFIVFRMTRPLISERRMKQDRRPGRRKRHSTKLAEVCASADLCYALDREKLLWKNCCIMKPRQTGLTIKSLLLRFDALCLKKRLIGACSCSERWCRQHNQANEHSETWKSKCGVQRGMKDKEKSRGGGYGER
ncbi:uncharacterized protein LOC142557148 isoform X2 [Dermacentor variabilis]